MSLILMQKTAAAALVPAARQGLAVNAARLLAPVVLRNANGAKWSKLDNSTQRRSLHQTSRYLASNISSLGTSSSTGTGGAFPVYFGKGSLPRNTIIRFVPQQTAWIVERMGKFNRILQPGLAVMIPFLDRIAYVKSLKEAAIEIPSQSAITADNVTLELDGVLYTRVFDAYKARSDFTTDSLLLDKC